MLANNRLNPIYSNMPIFQADNCHHPAKTPAARHCTLVLKLPLFMGIIYFSCRLNFNHREEPRKRRQEHSRGWSEAATAAKRNPRSDAHPSPRAPCRVAQRSGKTHPGHRPMKDNVIRKLKYIIPLFIGYPACNLGKDGHIPKRDYRS